MLKGPIRLSVAVIALVFVLVLGLVLGLVIGNFVLANRNNNTASASKPLNKPAVASVIIPQDQDMFDPYILPVQLNTTVTWQNTDLVAHTIITAPDQTPFLNIQAFSFNVGAGQNVKFKFTKPGLYHYYDNTMAKWDTSTSRVKANKGVPNYPLAMDGVIWVQGFIGDLPSGATNRIPTGHDDFATEFVAITDIGTISFHNFDEDVHFVTLAPGQPAPINPVSIGINRIGGTQDFPGGENITIIFSKPGLYYFYCANHALINKDWHRAQAFKLASEYPIPMEGFILVVGK
jgi:plastocyanin